MVTDSTSKKKSTLASKDGKFVLQTFAFVSLSCKLFNPSFQVHLFVKLFNFRCQTWLSIQLSWELVTENAEIVDLQNMTVRVVQIQGEMQRFYHYCKCVPLDVCLSFWVLESLYSGAVTVDYFDNLNYEETSNPKARFAKMSYKLMNPFDINICILGISSLIFIELLSYNQYTYQWINHYYIFNITMFIK